MSSGSRTVSRRDTEHFYNLQTEGIKYSWKIVTLGVDKELIFIFQIMSTQFTKFKSFPLLSCHSLRKMLPICQKTSPHIHTSKQVSLIDEEVTISGSGFSSDQPITIRASVQSLADKINLQSHAFLRTDSTGRFNLSKHESIGGSYCGLHPMGLFWSMDQTDGRFRRFAPGDVTNPYEFKFDVFDGHVSHFKDNFSLTSMTIQRRFVLPGIQRIPFESDGVYGTMFLPPGDGPFPGIVTVIPQSKRNGAENFAALLANHGFATFAVYFLDEGSLPKSFSHIRIEYFERAINHFIDMSSVSNKGVGIYGCSKGGEIALASATFLDSIKAAVCVNACTGSAHAETTYGENVIKPLIADFSKAKIVDNIIVNGVEAMGSIKDKPEMQIPVEQSKANILLIVGEDDRSWNSSEFVEVAKQRMHESGKQNLTVLKCPGAGHVISHPYCPPEILTSVRGVTRGCAIEQGGRDTVKQVQAQADSWEKTLSFFKENLST